VFGHENVRVLDGGLAKWLKEGRGVVSGDEGYAETEYKARFVPDRVIVTLQRY